MNTGIKAGLMFLALALYSLGFTHWFISPCCNALSLPEGMTVGFAVGSSEPLVGDGFAAFIEDLSSELREGRILVVTGLYHEGEPASEGYPNLGFARAAKLAALLQNKIPSEQIELKARLMPTAEAKADVAYIPGYLLEWRGSEEGFENLIEELEDRIIIRFPFGSAEKEYDPEVDSYLMELSEKIKESGDRVLITGHADNTGTSQFNMELSESRAQGIRDWLLARGVAADQLLTDAKGDTQPVASNETERGRFNNRRVEVRWLKQSNQ